MERHFYTRTKSNPGQFGPTDVHPSADDANSNFTETCNRLAILVATKASSY